MVKRLPTMRETQVRFLGRADLLQKKMATHSSTLAWKIPWMEEPGRLQSAAAAAKSLQSCPTLCDPIDGSPPRLPCPWDSPGKNTGVGCHFLLQCIKVKSESELPQSYPTLSDPMGCSPPGSSIHGIFQARVLEWGAIAFSREKYSNCLIISIASGSLLCIVLFSWTYDQQVIQST